MKIAVLGAGYVGRAVAESFALLEREVSIYDIDEGALGRLRRVQSDLSALAATNDLATALEGARVIFVTVGTPALKDGSADTSAVMECMRNVARLCAGEALVVLKSTVPPGTCEAAQAVLRSGCAARAVEAPQLCYNPEFLREGSALDDFLHPSRIVIGGEGDAIERLCQLYKPWTEFGAPVLKTDFISAELIKYACNGFLALKVAYVNELMDICAAAGADAATLLKAMALDVRIGGQHLRPSAGYGGGCLPKDTLAFMSAAKRLGAPMQTLDAAYQANRTHMLRVVDGLCAALGELDGKRIAALGLSFKPGVMDVRESAAVAIVTALVRLGATVCAHDPMAPIDVCIGEASFRRCATVQEALRESDALLALVAWDEYRALRPMGIRALMKGSGVWDCCMLFDRGELREAGLMPLN